MAMEIQYDVCLRQLNHLETRHSIISLDYGIMNIVSVMIYRRYTLVVSKVCCASVYLYRHICSPLGYSQEQEIELSYFLFVMPAPSEETKKTVQNNISILGVGKEWSYTVSSGVRLKGRPLSVSLPPLPCCSLNTRHCTMGFFFPVHILVSALW